MASDAKGDGKARPYHKKKSSSRSQPVPYARAQKKKENEKPSQDWEGWRSGKTELAAARRAGRWADGIPLGRGHGQPYLQAKYARDIRAQVKTVEGRPGKGWATNVEANDWITFKIPGSGGKTLVCRATQVRRFQTFEAMLHECRVDECLPGLDGNVEAGVNIYRSFGTFSGNTYAELEGDFGTIAIDVVPLCPEA
jgi:ASC-1-like (ASCH) protein